MQDHASSAQSSSTHRAFWLKTVFCSVAISLFFFFQHQALSTPKRPWIPQYGEEIQGPGYHLRIGRALGQGGMACVFLAQSLGAYGFTTDVVIKVINSPKRDDSDLEKMFQDEARIAGQLRHPNIVSIKLLGEHQETLFAVMDYIHGHNASELLKPNGNAPSEPIPLEATLFIIEQTLKGLQYVHTKTKSDGSPMNIIHRDISPHNLLVSMRGDVYITDFGIARADDRLAVTEADQVKGKRAYMSPEQLTGSRLDHRTDLFSLGVTAFELITGRKPFMVSAEIRNKAARETALAELIVSPNPAPSLDSILPGVHPKLNELINRLLKKLPTERFQSADSALKFLHDHFSADLLRGQQKLQSFMDSTFPNDVTGITHRPLPDELNPDPSFFQPSNSRSAEEPRPPTLPPSSWQPHTPRGALTQTPQRQTPSPTPAGEASITRTAPANPAPAQSNLSISTDTTAPAAPTTPASAEPEQQKPPSLRQSSIRRFLGPAAAILILGGGAATSVQHLMHQPQPPLTTELDSSIDRPVHRGDSSLDDRTEPVDASTMILTTPAAAENHVLRNQPDAGTHLTPSAPTLPLRRIPTTTSDAGAATRPCDAALSGGPQRGGASDQNSSLPLWTRPPSSDGPETPRRFRTHPELIRDL